MLRNSKKAFTLSEVLITLGVIGVVAAITLPTLIKNYQKTITVNKLKKTYTTLSQALQLSENQNGQIADWDLPLSKNADSMILWLQKYVTPYIKQIKLDKFDTERARLYMSDGVVVTFFYNSTGMIEVEIYINGVNKTKAGKDKFKFIIGNNVQGWATKNNFALIEQIHLIRPYDYCNGTCPNNINRNFWTSSTLYKCSSDGGKSYCAALIMIDGWKISDDYPWE